MSGVCFPKQVSRARSLARSPALRREAHYLPRGPPGSTKRELEKGIKDIKRSGVWKRKTAVRCKGSVFVTTGTSYRELIQAGSSAFYAPSLFLRDIDTLMPTADYGRAALLFMNAFIRTLKCN